MVIGTGDMSELALGWATYNGDHMSMYGGNAGVPKTLVRHLVRYYADTCGDVGIVLDGDIAWVDRVKLYIASNEVLISNKIYSSPTNKVLTPCSGHRNSRERKEKYCADMAEIEVDTSLLKTHNSLILRCKI